MVEPVKSILELIEMHKLNHLKIDSRLLIR